jgi:hypothetical protein
LAKVREEVTNGLLAVVEDLAGGGLVNSAGDLPAEFLKPVAEESGQGLGSEGGERVHARLQESVGSGGRQTPT